MARGGPVRQQTSVTRRTPYSRPDESIFGRVKRFLFGSHDLNTTSDYDGSNHAASISIGVSESFGGPQMDPNERLRRFWEQKGDAELSEIEALGVMSLIREAVSRNESVLDFSSLETPDVTRDGSLNASLLSGLASSSVRSFDSLASSSRRAPLRSPHQSRWANSGSRSHTSLASGPPLRSPARSIAQVANRAGADSPDRRLPASAARKSPSRSRLLSTHQSRPALAPATVASSTLLELLEDERNDGEFKPRRNLQPTDATASNATTATSWPATSALKRTSSVTADAEVSQQKSLFAPSEPLFSLPPQQNSWRQELKLKEPSKTATSSEFTGYTDKKAVKSLVETPGFGTPSLTARSAGGVYVDGSGKAPATANLENHTAVAPISDPVSVELSSLASQAAPGLPTPKSTVPYIEDACAKLKPSDSGLGVNEDIDDAEMAFEFAVDEPQAVPGPEALTQADKQFLESARSSFQF